MASITVPGMHGWDNPFFAVRRPWTISLRGEEGEARTDGIASQMMPRACPSLFFPSPRRHACLGQCRFLLRPQLLTRTETPSCGEGVS